jgi:hypothetical protein
MRGGVIAGAALVAVLSFAATESYAGANPAPPVVHVASGSSGAVWVPWAIGGCVVDIFAAAAVAHWRDNRELTHQEAYTCGLLFWFEPPAPGKRR